MAEGAAPFDQDYALEDRYRRESGRVYITGVQALVRLPLMQRQRDLAAGLDTAGFISGYRGSPLGTYDMALWQAKDALEQHHVHFEPGINEDLAATAVWGSQQAMLQPGPKYDGVFGIWYGKGPGVDRSTDPIKHANYLGTAAKGGVLAFCGDDPGGKSSSIAHQSEHALIHCGVPILNPANVQDYLDLGLYGWALSRYSGCWVGFKCLTDTVDSGALGRRGPRSRADRDARLRLPGAGPHVTFNNVPLQIERQLYQVKLPAALAFAAREPAGSRGVRFAEAPARHRHGRQGLPGRAPGPDGAGHRRAPAADLGITLYKVAMTWPLEPTGAGEFCRGLEDVLVVEEKRPIIEDQLARLLYNESERPRLLGKTDEKGAPLVPAEGELAPATIAGIVRRWLETRLGEEARHLQAPPQPADVAPPSQLSRLPSFCSAARTTARRWCPRAPSRSAASAVTGWRRGCPSAALSARPTWAARARTGSASLPSSAAHLFQNLGDGTYFHSGLLSIRACVAADVNITFKILVNGAVAMTGGQPIEGGSIEGEITTPEIVRQLLAEGVKQVVVVSNEPKKYPNNAFPPQVVVRHRERLIKEQQTLREVKGVTALVYDQTCAAEARRLRRRGEFPDPDRRIVINEAVCEGCGDCSVQSNCISVEPIETEFGAQAQDQPVLVQQGLLLRQRLLPELRERDGRQAAQDHERQRERRYLALRLAAGAHPAAGGRAVERAGHRHRRNRRRHGGRAHHDGRAPRGQGLSGLDVTGLAQKNGAVTSHVRIASSPEKISPRARLGSTDLLIGCDMVVATGRTRSRACILRAPPRW